MPITDELRQQIASQRQGITVASSPNQAGIPDYNRQSQASAARLQASADARGGSSSDSPFSGEIADQLQTNLDEQLGSISELETTIGEGHQALVAGERAKVQGQLQTASQDLIEQQARLGSPVNPYALGQFNTRNRIAGQAQVNRFQAGLAAQRAQQRGFATQMRLQAMQRVSPDFGQAVGLLQGAGQAQAARGNFVSGSVARNAARRAARGQRGDSTLFGGGATPQPIGPQGGPMFRQPGGGGQAYFPEGNYQPNVPDFGRYDQYRSNSPYMDPSQPYSPADPAAPFVEQPYSPADSQPWYTPEPEPTLPLWMEDL